MRSLPGLRGALVAGRPAKIGWQFVRARRTFLARAVPASSRARACETGRQPYTEKARLRHMRGRAFRVWPARDAAPVTGGLVVGAHA